MVYLDSYPFPSICSIRTDLGSVTECGGVDTGGVPAQGGLETVIWTYPGSRVLGVETGFVTLLIDPVFFGSCTNSVLPGEGINIII